jgi:hypothetical protein
MDRWCSSFRLNFWSNCLTWLIGATQLHSWFSHTFVAPGFRTHSVCAQPQCGFEYGVLYSVCFKPHARDCEVLSFTPSAAQIRQRRSLISCSRLAGTRLLPHRAARSCRAVNVPPDGLRCEQSRFKTYLTFHAWDRAAVIRCRCLRKDAHRNPMQS